MSRTLCVPIDLQAYCVSSSDTTRTQNFVGAQTDYSQLPFPGGRSGVSLISRDTGVIRPVDDSPLNPLRAGIHLHWALPRSLTVAAKRPVENHTDDDGQFPEVPNRWLLTRVLVIPRQDPQLKSWVIESDHLSTTVGDANADSVTIFTGNSGSAQQPYHYIGRALDASSWQETVTGMSTLKTLTGRDLTAVTSGDPLFAAFYPNCPNVFGFHDDLADVHLFGHTPHKILYAVQGWFSDASNDPLHGGLSAAEIEEQWQWQVSGHDHTTFDRSMYHGIVQQIEWQASRSYVEAVDDLGDGTPITADVAIGPGGAEALSALIGKAVLDPPHRQALEKLLTAYQVGTLTGLNDPLPDRSATLNDRLHRLGFGHLQAGDQWTVVNPGTADRQHTEETIPPTIAQAVAQLNEAQTTYDRKRHQVETCKQQLYSDWYRYNLAWQENDEEEDQYQGIDPDDISDYVDTACSALFQPDEDGEGATLLTQELATLHQDWLSKKSNAEQLMNQYNTQDLAHLKHWQLKRLSAPWYWHSNEPVVALSDVDLSHRQRGQRLTDPVPCRADDQLISALHVLGFPFRQLLGGHTLPTAPVPLSAALNEGLLLNSAWFAQHTGLSNFSSLIVQGFRDLIVHGQGNSIISQIQGIVPAALGAQWWNGQNPWQPLFMAWECYYHSAPDYDGQQQDYPTDFITGQFSLDDRGEFSPSFVPPADGGASGWILKGQSILTPLLAVRLEHALRQNSSSELQQDVQSALHYLQDTPMVFQGLSGFNDQLLMQLQTPRLSTLSTNTGDESGADQDLAQSVDHIIGPTRCPAPVPNQKFVPIRGGFAGFSFRLVDTFGLRRPITPRNFSCSTEMRTASSESSHLAYLPPRITQPSRLNFQLMSASDATLPSDTLLSPVCGWLLPNHLERSLMFYDDQGSAKGSLSTLSGQMHWLGAPGPNYGQSLSQALQGSSAALRSLASGLNQEQASFFGDIMETVRRVQENSNQATSQDPSLAVLIGRPMALVQAQIELELMGAAATNQSWDALQTDLNAAQDDDPSSMLIRAHNGFDAVQFEVQLGSLNRLHDGLIGFFMQDTNGDYDYSQFYSPGTDQNNAAIVDAAVQLIPNQGAINLLMLVNPLAKLHAVSGILPTQEIVLPAPLCLPALHGLSVTFPARPVLSPAGHARSLPLPTEPGYQWHWLQQTSTGWHSQAINPQKPSIDQSFSQQAIASGWLLLQPENS